MGTRLGVLCPDEPPKMRHLLPPRCSCVVPQFPPPRDQGGDGGCRGVMEEPGQAPGWALQRSRFLFPRREPPGCRATHAGQGGAGREGWDEAWGGTGYPRGCSHCAAPLLSLPGPPRCHRPRGLGSCQPRGSPWRQRHHPLPPPPPPPHAVLLLLPPMAA